MIVWEVGVDNRNIREQIFFEHRHHQSSFWAEGGVLIEGCLVPLIVSRCFVVAIAIGLEEGPFEIGVVGR